MRHNRKGHALGVDSAHREKIITNLMTALFKHGSIKTTIRRAKETRPYAEKLVTRAISGTLADKRIIISRLAEREVAHHLINDIAPELKERKGGYLRLIKLGRRDGDGAEMAVIELVSESVEKRQAAAEAKRDKKKAKKSKEAEKAKTAKEGKPETEEGHEKTHPRAEKSREHLAGHEPRKGTHHPAEGSKHHRTPPPSGEKG
jgi:large subunit ribosomal protein L17